MIKSLALYKVLEGVSIQMFPPSVQPSISALLGPNHGLYSWVPTFLLTFHPLTPGCFSSVYILICIFFVCLQQIFVKKSGSLQMMFVWHLVPVSMYRSHQFDTSARIWLHLQEVGEDASFLLTKMYGHIVAEGSLSPRLDQFKQLVSRGRFSIYKDSGSRR